MTVLEPLRQEEGTIGRLRRLHDHEGALLSVFITVPPDPAILRELPARLDALLDRTRLPVVNGDARRRARAALAAVRRGCGARTREWFGRTMALVASAEGGVLEEMRLPCAVPNQAAFGRRALLRPVLRALQRCRPYFAVVLDRRLAWLFDIGGDEIRRVRRMEDEDVPTRSYAGWYGLEEHRARRHAGELARRHYAATAQALRELGRPGRPFVVGGHTETVAEFLATLPPPLLDRVAGTFTIDPRTMTPDVVRARATTAMAENEAARHRRLAADLAEQEAAGWAVRGVEASAEAVAGSLAEFLVVWGDEPEPGWVCDGCGAMSSRESTCRLCRTPMRPVTDLVDVMVARMLDANRQVDLCGGEHAGSDVAVGLRRRRDRAGP